MIRTRARIQPTTQAGTLSFADITQRQALAKQYIHQVLSTSTPGSHGSEYDTFTLTHRQSDQGGTGPGNSTRPGNFIANLTRVILQIKETGLRVGLIIFLC